MGSWSIGGVRAEGPPIALGDHFHTTPSYLLDCPLQGRCGPLPVDLDLVQLHLNVIDGSFAAEVE